MNQEAAITCIFIDIGGVLLSNGWDRHARKQAAARFALDLTELEERHHLVFETYETGKLTLDEYLDLVIFHQQRPFPREQVRECIFAQTQPYPEMIALLRNLKEQHNSLKILAVNNEARELNTHRIATFKLNEFIEREAFQEIDYRRMFGQMAKWVAQIDRADRIPEYMLRAFQTATSVTAPSAVRVSPSQLWDGRPNSPVICSSRPYPGV